MAKAPGDRGRATEEYRGNGRDRTDNWFNNGANRLHSRHPIVFWVLIVAFLAAALSLKLL